MQRRALLINANMEVQDGQSEDPSEVNGAGSGVSPRWRGSSVALIYALRRVVRDLVPICLQLRRVSDL